MRCFFPPTGARTAALALLLSAVAVACAGDDSSSPSSSSSSSSAAALPACAAALPVPGGVDVVEVTAEPTEANPTCAVTLSSAEGVDEVVAAWQSVLEKEGIRQAVHGQPGVQRVLQLKGPVCGSVLVFAAGTERVTDAVPADRTPVLVSILECPSG